MKLSILMPFLAKELTQELNKIGETELANTVSQLDILGRCDCDNQSCAAFYTAEKHIWSGNEVRHVIPHVKGVYSVDVFRDQIVFIEIMGRQDVRERLLAVCP